MTYDLAFGCWLDLDFLDIANLIYDFGFSGLTGKYSEGDGLNQKYLTMEGLSQATGNMRIRQRHRQMEGVLTNVHDVLLAFESRISTKYTYN
jgi:hypothetical protein